MGDGLPNFYFQHIKESDVDPREKREERRRRQEKREIEEFKEGKIEESRDWKREVENWELEREREREES